MTKLSDPCRSLSGVHTPNPWEHLGRHWPEVVVTHDLTPPGPRAQTDFTTSPPTIRLRPGLSQRERRCCIAHETRHLERGPIVRGMRATEERIVCDLTARWLLPDLTLLRTALADYGLHDAAEHLWVTWSVLVDRLNGLTDAESRYVHGALLDSA